MAWFIIESLAFIIVAFLLGLLVGWLIWGRRGARSEENASARTSAAAGTPVEPAPAEASAEKASEEAPEKAGLVAVGTATAASASDDLTEPDANRLVTEPDAVADRDAALEAELAADAMVAEAQVVAAVSEPEVVTAEGASKGSASKGADDEAAAAETAPAGGAADEAADAPTDGAADAPAEVAALPAVEAAVSEAQPGTPDDPELDEAAAAEVVAEAEAVARQAAEAAAAEETAGEGSSEAAEAPAEAGEESAEGAAPAVVPVVVPAAEAAPAAEPAAAAEPQDLRRIEGIGPKIEAALKAAGYTTYAKVAVATETELRAAIKASGIKFAPAASTWAAQAEYLAAGDEDGLKEYQDYLVAGQERTGKFNDKVDYADVDQIDDEAAKAAAIAADEAEAAALAAAEPEPQDLQRIEGIGPKIESALKAAGYTTYAKVAAASETELREAILTAGIKFAPAASSWSDQAQYLVDDDEAGLKEYQEYLVAGQDRAGKFNEKVDYTDVDQIEDEAAKAAAIAEDEAEAAAAEATTPARTEPETEVKA